MPTIKNFKHKIELDNELSGETAKEERFKVKKESAQAEKSQERGVDGVQAEEVLALDEQTGGRETAGLAAAQSAAQKQKEREKKIESILSKNMEEIYLSMTPIKQQEFKITGEQTAREINGLLEKTKVQVKKVIDLIKKWLSVIPNINKFFLEQESKIKADDVMKLRGK